MKPFPSSLRSVLAINVHLLTASACGFVAWAVWPQSPEWWGFGVLSIVLAVGSVIAVGKALKEAAGLYRKAKAISDYVSQGSGPKPARMVSVDDLKRAGMLDD